MFAPSQSKGPNQRDEEVNGLEPDNEMQMQIKLLTNTIEQMQSPTGRSKKNPARSCMDLFMSADAAGEKLMSDWYWIDPNGGCQADAIKAFCNFESRETCLDANNGSVRQGTHFRGYTDKHVYFGEMQNGYKFDYSPRDDAVSGANYESQITFLRLLSSQARQMVTYHCKNSIAAFDKASRDYSKALKLLGSNGVEMTAEGSETYEVLEDGCQTGSSSADKTVVQYATKKTARLPIVDVAARDIGDDKEFGIEMGPICFA
jgi:hypothetical protein